ADSDAGYPDRHSAEPYRCEGELRQTGRGAVADAIPPAVEHYVWAGGQADCAIRGQYQYGIRSQASQAPRSTQPRGQWRGRSIPGFLLSLLRRPESPRRRAETRWPVSWRRAAAPTPP